ncbi:MAG: hypothetical protein RIC55_02510 [Pirellulaceae bacterium]
MYEGHARDSWGRLANLMALIANCHREAKRRPWRAADFDPYSRGGGRGFRLTAGNLHLLKGLFTSDKS